MFGGQGLAAAEHELAPAGHVQAAGRVHAGGAPVGGDGALGVPQKDASHDAEQTHERNDPQQRLGVQAAPLQGRPQLHAREDGRLGRGPAKREQPEAGNLVAPGDVGQHEQGKQRERDVGELHEERDGLAGLRRQKRYGGKRHHRQGQRHPRQDAHVELAPTGHEQREQGEADDGGGDDAVRGAHVRGVQQDGAREARGQTRERHERDDLPRHGVAHARGLARTAWHGRGTPGALAGKSRERHGGREARPQGQKADAHVGGQGVHPRDGERDDAGKHAPGGAVEHAARGPELAVHLGPQEEEDGAAHGRKRTRRREREARPQGGCQVRQRGREDARGHDGRAARPRPARERPQLAREHGRHEERAYVPVAHEGVRHLGRARVARKVHEHVRQVRAAQPGNEQAHAQEAPRQHRGKRRGGRPLRVALPLERPYHVLRARRASHLTSPRRLSRHSTCPAQKRDGTAGAQPGLTPRYHKTRRS